jgi:hypothetical protein
MDRAALYGFFVSVEGAAPLVVVCVAVVVCGAAVSPGAPDVVAVVVSVVVVVSVGDAELVVWVVVEAGTGSAGSFGFFGHAIAATTSNPVAIRVSFFMYSLLVHTIAPCALKDLTAI